MTVSERQAALKAKMMASRLFLVTTFLRIQESELDMPTANEGWTVGNVAAHIAGAEGSMKVLAERILAQEPTIVSGFDLTRFNEGNIRRRAGKTINELLQELEQSRAQMSGILDNCSDEQLDLPGEHPAYGQTTLFGLFEIIANHEQQHAEEISHAINTHKHT